MDQDDLNQLTERVIGAAYEGSNVLGIGFLEKVYENALMQELRLRGLAAEAQRPLVVRYKGVEVGHYLADMVVEKRLLVELKCATQIAPEHIAQCLNYLRGTGFRLALILNFQTSRVGVKRVAL